MAVLAALAGATATGQPTRRGSGVDGASPPVVDIVVARFDEDVGWLDAFSSGPHRRVIIFDKGEPPITGSTRLPNVGRESHTYRRPLPQTVIHPLCNAALPRHSRHPLTSTPCALPVPTRYLYHIASSYDKLADWTVFTQAAAPTWGYHGERYSGHLSSAVRFEHYLEPRNEGAFFVHTRAVDFSRWSSNSSLAHAARMSYIFNDPAKNFVGEDGSCPGSFDDWSLWWQDDGTFR